MSNNKSAPEIKNLLVSPSGFPILPKFFKIRREFGGRSFPYKTFLAKIEMRISDAQIFALGHDPARLVEQGYVEPIDEHLALDLKAIVLPSPETPSYFPKNKMSEQSQRIMEIRAALSDTKLRRAGIYSLAQLLRARFHIIVFMDTDEVYLYADGVYCAGGERKLASYIQQELDLGEFITTNVIHEVLGHIRRSAYKPRATLKEPTDKICLENGVLTIPNFKVLPHCPEIVFFSKLPVLFDPNADCPAIKKFLSEVLKADDVLLVQEIVGYCLLKENPYQKAFIFHGGGANGKSIFISVVREFLGRENCASVSLQALENNRFSLSSLFGKSANLFADLPSEAIKGSSAFKMLVGDDFVRGEKKFKDEFFFVMYAKMIFSANQLPKSPEDTDAFFRRWIIVDFPNQFLGLRADQNLLKKLTTPEELAGLLNWALEGLSRLLRQSGFSNSLSIDRTRQEWVRKSDSVGSFIMDIVQVSPDSHVPKKDLYVTYSDYCRKMNYPISAENSFHKQLQSQIRVEDYRPIQVVLGCRERVQCWKGIKVVALDFKSHQPDINKENNPDNPDIPDIPDATSPKEAPHVNHVNDVNPFSPIKLQLLAMMRLVAESDGLVAEKTVAHFQPILDLLIQEGSISKPRHGFYKLGAV